MRANPALMGLALAVLAGAGGAWAQPAPPTVGPGGCYDPTQSNADFEAYGPTDVTVQAGNNRVTANENAAGTVTVFKYPDPSLFNQIKYFAVSRDAKGVVHTTYPNEGSFAGLAWKTRSGTRFAWLREWPSTQGWVSPDLPVPVTTWRAPAALGLTVTATDLAPPGTDAFVRRFVVRRTRRSPVRAATLYAFANFNPTADHVALLPIDDWCTPGSDGTAAYDAASHAAATSWTGTDTASASTRTIAVAFGLGPSDTSHQVGQDDSDTAPDGTGGPDGFAQAATGDHRLGGGTSATGQTTITLARALLFDRHGRAAVRVLATGGPDPSAALAALRAARGRRFAAQLASERRTWHALLAQTKLPRGAPARVLAVAKRSLISLLLARAPKTGAIVASVNTQGPYGEDWIRDGAFLNHTLDINGFADDVAKHNAFYARIQASETKPSALRPPGNWTMAAYSDGVDGAPIPWEIDETGLGIWTLYEHALFVPAGAVKGYLAGVYPAITRAANFLTTCQDPTNGLQCNANEDDNYTPSQSLHGAETVWLGLRSAIAAAKLVGDSSANVASWKTRLASLGAAIDKLYDPTTRSYSEAQSGSNAYNLDYSDGGWLLWPVQFKPYSDPTMQGEADAVYASVTKALAGERGQYESKALLGLAYAWQSDPAKLARLRAPLRFIADKLTTPTGLLGESWEKLADGRRIPVQDMPHVWEHALFYLAALKVYGARPYFG